MRDFNLDDVYSAWDLLDAAGFDDKQVEGLLKIASEGKGDVTSVGIKAITKVLRAFAEKGAQSAMYKFLSGPFEKAPEEIGKMSLREIAEGIQWLLKEGYIKDFILSLADSHDTN